MKNIRIFMLGIVLTLFVFMATNILSVQLLSDCGLLGALGISGCRDNISRGGFPLQVWEQGGFAYHMYFDMTGLIVNILSALVVSFLVGLISQWLWAKRPPKVLA